MQRQTSCPECSGPMLYEASTKKYLCERCGLYVSKDQIETIRSKLTTTEDSMKRKRRQQGEYLEWWLSARSAKKSG